MGAEGGINWIHVEGGSEGMRLFRDLISPFWPLHFEDHDSYGGEWDSHYSYLRENPPHEEWYVSTYGTNQTFQGMDTFLDMIHEVMDPEFDSLRDMTFGEVCLELMTRPDDLRYKPLTLLEQVCLQSFGLGYQSHYWDGPDYYSYKLWEDRTTPRVHGNLPDILETKVQDWLSSVLGVVDIEQAVGFEETWT